MTWIRCSDRMPMGEACEVRCHDCVWGESEHIFPSATVETLRRAFADGRGGDWIDRTEWRPVELLENFEELPAVEARPDGKMDVTFSARLPVELDEAEHVYTVKPGCDEAVRDLLRSDKPVPEKLRELMVDRYDTDPDTIRASLRRFGFTEQARMLQEECGELIAAINHWFRDRDDAFDLMIEEIADVEILIDQMRLEFGAEIDAARARKLARLKERLER